MPARPLRRPWRLRSLLVLALALLPPAHGQASRPEPESEVVSVCFDEADHTPYLYRDDKGHWRGATLDLTRALLERAGLRPRWLPLPWSRCLREVEEFGRRGAAELLFYASLNAERERKFLASLPLHRIHGGVWYSRQAMPQPPPLRRITDLGDYRLCGMYGHNYAWLAALGVTQVDTGALNLRAVLEKLQRGRCELVLSTREQVRGAAQLGLVSLPPEFDFLPYPERQPVTQHLLLSRESPRAAELQQRLDRALRELRASGEAERIYRRYMPEGSGLAD